MKQLSPREIYDLANRAALAAGFDSHVAECLAESTVGAQAHRRSPVGLVHLFDYFSAAESGLINTAPEVQHEAIMPAIVLIDADDGPMQFAFSAYSDEFIEATRSEGIAMMTIRNAFAGGELGYYARRLANQGILSIMTVNSPAVMSFSGSTGPLLGTNPLCYGVPLNNGKAIIVDQASSNTALAKIQQMAAEGTKLPEGWALDSDGKSTTEPTAALAGTLLPFGSYKGGNIGMMVELLALMGGAQPSLEAISLYEGTAPPKIGGTIIAVDLQKFPGYKVRVETLLQQFVHEHSVGLRLVHDLSKPAKPISIAENVIHDLEQFIANPRAAISTRF